MRVVWFHEVVDKTSLREHMKGARWLLIRQQDLENATQAWMFAELDGFLIGVDHRLSKFKSGIHNRAIHLLLLSEKQDSGYEGITKVIVDKSGKLEDHLF